MTESNEKSLVAYTDAEKGGSVGDLRDKYILLIEERDALREKNGVLERLNEAYKEQNELLKDCLKDLKSLLEGKIEEK